MPNTVIKTHSHANVMSGLDALGRSIDTVIAERNQLRTTNAAMLQALHEVAGDYLFLDPDTGASVCVHCGVAEGDAHDPDCTMNFVLDAIARAEGR